MIKSTHGKPHPLETWLHEVITLFALSIGARVMVTVMDATLKLASAPAETTLSQPQEDPTR